ncbi:hypothetical protein [Limisalsivibrio acetivorans]|uniref:phage tail tube protein n=1 Tax=Limisalsivibrio acetivorans TaxID=1304888 RepID=UPI0003B7577E|nr:hypothetical protein [Limisalsivibrio acetivorans]
MNGEYTSSRGRLYFRGTEETAHRDMGNVSSLSLSVKNETKERFGEKDGVLVPKESILVRRVIELEFVLDRIGDENLSIFFSTNPNSYPEQSFTEELYIDGSGCYPLGYVDISNAELTSGGISYIEGSDYEILKREGMLRIPEGSSVPASTATLSGYSGSNSRLGVSGGRSVAGDIFFVGDADNGRTLRFSGRVSLAPKGGISPADRDWVNLPFAGVFIDASSNESLIDIDIY